MALRLAFLAVVALSASTAVMAHEGHHHASSTSGSMAGSDHDDHEAGEDDHDAAGSHHEDDKAAVKNTTSVPTPAPTKSAASGAVFSIALPLSAAAVATIAAAH